MAVPNSSQLKEVKDKKRITMLRNYGVDNPSRDPAVRRKRLETKRKNGTFTTSTPENKAYKILLSKYPDIVRQYSSDKYPYMCDFYIPSTDTYIEYNGNWTHGGHPFDPLCEEDNAVLSEWKTKNTQYYDSAIDVWTVRDPDKRKTASASGIHYIELWNIDDVLNYVCNENE